jgi:hypothetical protein
MILPASGLMEVCYALLQSPNDDPGILTLYRGVRAPALQPGGFFEPSADGETTFDVAWVRKNLTPVATGVIGLDVLCWGPNTTEWDRPSRDRRPASALEIWDSTRGILEAFPLTAGAASLKDGRDDLYPKRIRLVLTLTRPGRPDARLARRVGPAEETISVDSAERLPREGDPGQDICVQGEWMTIVKRDFGSFRVARSPVKNAAGGFAYAAGTPVYVGRKFEQTVNLPDPRPSYEGIAR